MAKLYMAGKHITTHCSNGHKFTEENSYWFGNMRVCRECTQRKKVGNTTNHERKNK